MFSFSLSGKGVAFFLVLFIQICPISKLLAQSSCPFPQGYTFICSDGSGNCGVAGGSCNYLASFPTSFNGNNKYVLITIYADGSLIHQECLGPFPSSTESYSVPFVADCDADLYGLYSAFTNSSASNPCGGNACEDGFCAYGVCQEGIYLPITLESFVANKTSEHIELKWVTTSEENNDFFRLEKSRDGLIWQLLSEKKASLVSSLKKSYAVIDPFPYLGTNYYRLIQVDLDGSEHFSGVVIIDFNRGDLVYLSEEQHLVCSYQASSDVSVSILDFQGKTISKMILTPGEEREIRPGQLSAGLYLLRIQTDRTTQTRKAYLK